MQLASCVLRKEWKMPETSQSWVTTGPAMVGSILNEFDLPRQNTSNERAKHCSLQSAKAETPLKAQPWKLLYPFLVSKVQGIKAIPFRKEVSQEKFIDT